MFENIKSEKFGECVLEMNRMSYDFGDGSKEYFEIVYLSPGGYIPEDAVTGQTAWNCNNSEYWLASKFEEKAMEAFEWRVENGGFRHSPSVNFINKGRFE